MKLKWIAVLGMMLLAAPVGAEEAPALKTQQDKVNYGIGVSVGKNIKRQGVEVDQDLVVRGLKDELAGKSLMTDEELQKIMTEFRTELQQKQAKARTAAAEENKKEGAAFLAANKKKEGVVTLKDGLQYKILKAGQGKKPGESDTVEVNYRGSLINGKVFDSSKPGTPATFKVNQVIPGWQEALKLMPVGSKWQLFVPSDLAYGERGMGQAIMPNTMLIFEVELVGIKSAGSAAPK